MGLDYNVTRLILTGLRFGADFSSLLTLARVNVNLKRKDLCRALTDFRSAVSADVLDLIYASGPYPYGEPLLHALGARTLDAIDASAYEGATIVHDMNESVPTSLHDRYTAVVDHGTMEHIFNFPVLVTNCMKMLKVGGHFLSAACCNNFTGHGFYQFSPELYFRVFSEENGFSIRGVFLVEETSTGPWYRVMDPALIKERVTLRNSQPTYIMLIAQKVANVATFATPQQSDYAAAWTRPQQVIMQSGGVLGSFVKRYLPRKATQLLSDIKYRVQNRYLWSHGFRSKYYFLRFDPASGSIGASGFQQ